MPLILPPAAAPVPLSLVDAKGDLIVGTANDALARLAVGPDGQVLTADAASGGGVKWAAASGGGGSSPNGVGADAISIFANVGAYQPSFNFQSTIGTGAIAIGNRFAVPFRPAGNFTADQIGVEVSTAGAAGSLFGLALYASNAAASRPDALITDYGTIATDTTGYKLITISQAFTANTVYWLAWGTQVAAPTTRSRTSLPKYPDTQARAFDGFASSGFAFQMNGAGAFPSNWVDNGVAASGIIMPVIVFRRSA